MKGSKLHTDITEDVHFTRRQLINIVAAEIRSSDILPDDLKGSVLYQIQKELHNCSPQIWFNCKMILFQNRYNSVSKENFLRWLDTTHLKQLIEYKEE